MAGRSNLPAADWLVPRTGAPKPDPSASPTAAAAAAAFDTARHQHPAHSHVIQAFDRARLAGLASGAGRKLAIGCLGPSGSGKTTTMATFASSIALNRPPVRGRPAAPVVIVPIDNGCTNRRLWASVLEAHGDSPGKGTEESFRARAYNTMRLAGTEMLVLDESQHLVRSHATRDVTDSIKRMLDDGVVTLGLVGTEQARPLLTSNIQLSNRMLAPADIRPLDHKSKADFADFVAFVGSIDASVVSLGLLHEQTGMTEDNVIICLFAVSKGVVGVVVNLIRQALMHAVERGATRIEVYDLCRVTTEWAVATGVCASNPFTSMPTRKEAA